MSDSLIYLDYNATSPLALSVTEYLKSGEVDYLNASSVHKQGRSASRELRSITKWLRKFFSVPSDYHLYYQSGATEGISTLLRGFFDQALLDGKKPEDLCFVCSPLDHAAVVKHLDLLSRLGAKTYFLPVTNMGEIHWDKTHSLMSEIRNDFEASNIFVNYTWVNNETGVVWPLEDAQNLKNKFGCFIHIDACQTLGKIKDPVLFSEKLNLDAFTFSGHKFGAMKGVGLTLQKNSLPCQKLFHGGGQQGGLRAGTENILGIKTLQLSLQEMESTINYKEMEKKRIFLEQGLKSFLGEAACIVGEDAKQRNLNTVLLKLKNIRSDVLVAALDFEGVMASSGSACSSGSFSNRILKALDKENDCYGPLRLSFSPWIPKADLEKFIGIFKKLYPKLANQ